METGKVINSPTGQQLEQLVVLPLGTATNSFGDSHKVKIGRKRSKIDDVELGKMVLGCGCPQVLSAAKLLDPATGK